jgi:hypothetical protein
MRTAEEVASPLSLCVVLGCALTFSCRSEGADVFAGESGTTGTAGTVGSAEAVDPETTGTSTGPSGWPTPEPPDLPPLDGAGELGCHAGLRKVVLDGGPVTGVALWSGGASRVVTGANAVRRISDDAHETISLESAVVDATFGPTEDAHVLTKDRLIRISSTGEEVLFGTSLVHEYEALAVTDALEALIVGEHTYCVQDDEFGKCLRWQSRGALWRVPTSEPRFMTNGSFSSVASHGEGEAVIAGPDRVHFVGESNSFAVALTGGQVWLDPLGGYFIATAGDLHHYVPGGELVPFDLPGVADTDNIVALGRDANEALRAVVASGEQTRVVTGDDLSVIAFELPPHRTAGRGAFSRGQAGELIVSSPLGAEIWMLASAEPVWDANTPTGGEFHVGLEPDASGYAVNGGRTLYARAGDGRWTVVAELPIDAKRVVPWNEGAMVAGESAVYEWTGTSFIERTPELGVEQIEDMVVGGDVLWLLSRSDPWKGPPSVFRRHHETWSKTSVANFVTELVPSDDGPVLFPPSGGALEWMDGEWIGVEANYWWTARAYAVASTRDIYGIVRFPAGSHWGVGRLDRSTDEWSVEPVPSRDWLWTAATGTQVWVLARDAAAHFDGQVWHARAFEDRGAAGRALVPGGVLVHERDRVVLIEPCDR